MKVHSQDLNTFGQVRQLIKGNIYKDPELSCVYLIRWFKCRRLKWTRMVYLVIVFFVFFTPWILIYSKVTERRHDTGKMPSVQLNTRKIRGFGETKGHPPPIPTVSAGTKGKVEKMHWAEDQKRRHQTVQKVCTALKHRHSVPKPDKRAWKNFWVDDKHKLVYCSVPKVGSTTIKRFLLSINGKYVPVAKSGIVHNKTLLAEYGLKSLDQYSETERQQRLKAYTNFYVVRHPLQRLLSAYGNKFVGNNEPFRLRYGTRIIRRYRKNPSDQSLKRGHDVTFPEFIEYITDPDPKIHGGEFEPHWREMHKVCFPCTIKYRMVAKLETFDRDMWWLWKKIAPGKRFDMPVTKSLGDLTKTKLPKYYQKLSKKAIQNIRKIYAVDFDMYSYDINIIKQQR